MKTGVSTVKPGVSAVSVPSELLELLELLVDGGDRLVPLCRGVAGVIITDVL